MISIADFKVLTDYRLAMTDIKTADGVEMADDFVEFTTSRVNVSAVEFYDENNSCT